MRILAIDYGDARVGYAICDPTGFLASALTTLHERNMNKVVDHTVELCGQYNVEKIILGYPKNMNNSIGERAKISENFREALISALPSVPVILWDERGSTVSAKGILNVTDTRGKKRKNIIDSLAAAIILQSYLDSLKNNPII